MPELTRAQLIRLEAYQATFTSAHGQQVLEDLRISFGDRRSFVVGDPYLTAFHEGQRDVYLGVKDVLAVAADPTQITVVEGLVEDEAA